MFSAVTLAKSFRNAYSLFWTITQPYDFHHHNERMRNPMRSKAPITILALLVASACAEPTTDPTLPSQPTRAAGSKANSGIEFRMLVRKHGKAKRYRGTLDPQQHSLQVTSITNPACYDYDPTCNGENATECPLTDADCQYGSYDASGQDSMYIENPSPSSGAWYDSGPWVCPEYVSNPEFTALGRPFKLQGVRIYRIAFLSMSSGIPKARYAIPPGLYESEDGTLRIRSGTLDGTCLLRRETYGGIFEVIQGYMLWYKFQGVSEDLTFWGGGQGQAQDGVWVSYGGNNGSGTYMDPEARVLERYMNGGVCTPGWAIFVNGAQVC